jgi:hypothetical protein
LVSTCVDVEGLWLLCEETLKKNVYEHELTLRLCESAPILPSRNSEIVSRQASLAVCKTGIESLLQPPHERQTITYNLAEI